MNKHIAMVQPGRSNNRVRIDCFFVQRKKLLHLALHVLGRNVLEPGP